MQGAVHARFHIFFFKRASSAKLWGVARVANSILSAVFLTSKLLFFSESVNGQFMINSGVSEAEKQDIIKHIDELKYAEKRDNALLELSR